MQKTVRVLSELEAKLESFHDVHVHGLRWRRDQFSFSMDLQYILQWIESTGGAAAYRFSICEARLVFRDVDELKISMEWSSESLDSQIDVVRILESRMTPNGQVQQYFEIEFSNPQAGIMFWSTGYEVCLLTEPVISDVTSIPLSE
jgi:hypothetical protein